MLYRAPWWSQAAVLNDRQHRSVAAEIVAFLAALRDDLTPAITIETSTW